MSARAYRWFAVFAFVAAAINGLVLLGLLIVGEPWFDRLALTATMLLVGVLNLDLRDKRLRLDTFGVKA